MSGKSMQPPAPPLSTLVSFVLQSLNYSSPQGLFMLEIDDAQPLCLQTWLRPNYLGQVTTCEFYLFIALKIENREKDQ